MKQALVVSSVLCGSPLHAKGWQASASTSARADGLAAVSFFARKPI
jgi:hypothetical protein